MNRQQRRAKGVKSNDPVLMVKRSDAREYVNSLVKNDPIVQKAIQEEVRRLNLEEARRQEEDINALILMTLHRTFGFGKTRLMRFVDGLADLQKYYAGRYEEYDLIAMKKHLKEDVGIDVSKLLEEVEQVATEESSN